MGLIAFPVELDGRHGLFILDTGSPRFWLNPLYLRPSATGGIDTVTTEDSQQAGFVTVHTMRVGTMLQSLDTTGVGPPTPRGPTNGNIMYGNITAVGVDVLGTFGLPAMEPFETIIDYPRRRVVLIRLDKAGHRLAAVPAYTPASTTPLLPVNEFWWGIARQENSHGIEIDTGGYDTGGILGYHFLSELKIVGFNLRARQFVVYSHPH